MLGLTIEIFLISKKKLLILSHADITLFMEFGFMVLKLYKWVESAPPPPPLPPAPPSKLRNGNSLLNRAVKVIPNSPSQDYSQPDDQNLRTYDMTPGFKPFTVLNRAV